MKVKTKLKKGMKEGTKQKEDNYTKMQIDRQIESQRMKRYKQIVWYEGVCFKGSHDIGHLPPLPSPQLLMKFSNENSASLLLVGLYIYPPPCYPL